MELKKILFPNRHFFFKRTAKWDFVLKQVFSLKANFKPKISLVVSSIRNSLDLIGKYFFGKTLQNGTKLPRDLTEEY